MSLTPHPFIVTGRPMATAHDALARLMQEANGVMITGRGVIELQKDHKPLARIEIADHGAWKRFCEACGQPS